MIWNGAALSPIAVPAPEYRVLEGCAVRGCDAEVAKFRCGQCFVARYCGTEHSKQDWSEHKKSCVPLTKRPFVAIDMERVLCMSVGAHYNEVKYGQTTQIEPMAGVVVVKLIGLEGQWIKVFDQSCRFAVTILADMIPEETFSRVMSLLFTKGFVATCGHHGNIYIDAEISVPGRLLFFLDKAHYCEW